MRRWQEDHKKVYNTWKKEKEWLSGYKNLHQLGRFRKMHPLDCGKSHCRVCHCDKYPKRELTQQEIISNIDFKEQL